MQHLSFFQSGKTSSKLQLPDELYMRILQILHNIKTEIDSYRQNDVYVLRALLYEVLMLLDREYKKVNMEEETTSKEVGNIHIDKFMKLVESHLKEQHSVQYYADKLCITPNYLNEIVTSTKGISAKQYIRNKAWMRLRDCLLIQISLYRILRLNFISQLSLILSVASGNILEQRHYFIEERINRKK